MTPGRRLGPLRRIQLERLYSIPDGMEVAGGGQHVDPFAAPQLADAVDWSASPHSSDPLPRATPSTTRRPTLDTARAQASLAVCNPMSDATDHFAGPP